ncbi:MAG: deoxyribonuclease IV [Pirellulaceae bacterium]
MLKLGSHMSIAGGYYNAVEAAAAAGCDCVQLFTKNNNQWRAKPITSDESAAFAEALQRLKICDPLSHSSYLINLASPDEALRCKSVDAMVVELGRAHQLGISGVVMHPGAFTTSSAEMGLKAIATSLREIFAATDNIATRILLENTAGQGSCLGWQFEQLAIMIDSVPEHSDRLGVCIDTCHAFAAGYNLTTDGGFADMVKAMKNTFGLERIRALHLNDSKKELGSRVDRHEHIGDGELGIESFRRVLTHPQLKKLPMYLETEKGTDPQGVDWDVVNLQRLRSCVAK